MNISTLQAARAATATIALTLVQGVALAEPGVTDTQIVLGSVTLTLLSAADMAPRAAAFVPAK